MSLSPAGLQYCAGRDGRAHWSDQMTRGIRFLLFAVILAVPTLPTVRAFANADKADTDSGGDKSGAGGSGAKKGGKKKKGGTGGTSGSM
jgi:hypothetical protein